MVVSGLATATLQAQEVEKELKSFISLYPSFKELDAKACEVLEKRIINRTANPYEQILISSSVKIGDVVLNKKKEKVS